MWFLEADSAALGRCLAQIGEDSADLVELYFEECDETELRPDGAGPGVVEKCDRGLAVRLVRKGCTYVAASDDLEAGALAKAFRDVARASPGASYRVPELRFESSHVQGAGESMAEFPGMLRRSLKDRLASIRFRLRLKHHRRRVQVVGERLIPSEERQEFFSVEIATASGRLGQLVPTLNQEWADGLADLLLDRYQARAAKNVISRKTNLVLGPAATAVVLHEAVAHGLEADTLALTGKPEAAIGVTLGSSALNVLDNPGGGPPNLSRNTDDEGFPVERRWLLREGVVAEPLADRVSSIRSPALMAGAGRRGSRHLPPVPRSTHLELIPGEASTEELIASTAGVYLPIAERGRLDPLSGRLTVEFPYGYELRGGRKQEAVGSCRISAQLSEVLGAVSAVGSDAEFAGAGWCAKDGHLLPVWSTCPALALTGLRLES